MIPVLRAACPMRSKCQPHSHELPVTGDAPCTGGLRPPPATGRDREEGWQWRAWHVGKNKRVHNQCKCLWSQGRGLKAWEQERALGGGRALKLCMMKRGHSLKPNLGTCSSWNVKAMPGRLSQSLPVSGRSHRPFSSRTSWEIRTRRGKAESVTWGPRALALGHLPQETEGGAGPWRCCAF